MADSYLLTPQQTCLAVLKMIEARDKERGRPTNYLRISRRTLRDLSNRFPLTDDFVRELQSWLWKAGWVLFDAGSIFGIAKAEAVENWPRSTSALIASDLAKMKAGSYDFENDAETVFRNDDDRA
jgi:hypothetical protein